MSYIEVAYQKEAAAFVFSNILEVLWINEAAPPARVRSPEQAF
jgi:hypothetical protein